MGLPKWLTPPAKFRGQMKQATVAAASYYGGKEAGANAGKAFDTYATTVDAVNKATKHKAAGAATSSQGSTAHALSDMPGSDEPASTKPRSLFDFLLSLFGLNG